MDSPYYDHRALEELVQHVPMDVASHVLREIDECSDLLIDVDDKQSHRASEAPNVEKTVRERVEQLLHYLAQEEQKVEESGDVYEVSSAAESPGDASNGEEQKRKSRFSFFESKSKRTSSVDNVAAAAAAHPMPSALGIKLVAIAIQNSLLYKSCIGRATRVTGSDGEEAQRHINLAAINVDDKGRTIRSGAHTFTEEQIAIHQEVEEELKKEGVLPIQDVHKFSDADLISRFLIEGKWKKKHAIKELKGYKQWRAEKGIDRIFEHEFAQANMAEEWFHGKARNGLPCYYFHPVPEDGDKMFKKVGKEKAIMWHVAVAEVGRYIQTRTGKDRGVAVVDLSSVGISAVRYTEVMKILGEWSNVDQHYMPENLAAIYAINTPRSISVVWKVLSVMLDETIKSKIKFLKSTDELHEYVAPDQIPKRFGGTSKEDPLSMAEILQDLKGDRHRVNARFRPEM